MSAFAPPGERWRVGRTEPKTGGERNEEIVAIAGNPGFIVRNAARALGKQEIPLLIGARDIAYAGRINDPVPDRKD
jgi:hypothetical protein